MKKILLLLCIFSSLFSLELPLENTAYLLEKSQKEIGICHPLRLGKTNDKEFSIHPILGFVIPNFKMKGKLYSSENTDNSYFLKLTYPTPLLKMVQKKGIGGLIAEDPKFEKIPHILVSEIGTLTSKKVKDKYFMTFSGSLAFSVGLGAVDPRITIDLPYFYPRMNLYNADYSLSTGFHFTGPIWENIGFDFGGKLNYTLGTDNNISMEIRDNLFWQFKPNTKLIIGYKLFYAEYPFGNQWDMIPAVDLRYSW